MFAGTGLVIIALVWVVLTMNGVEKVTTPLSELSSTIKLAYAECTKVGIWGGMKSLFRRIA
jgi:Na+(H+)/acetate symporter ActP